MGLLICNCLHNTYTSSEWLVHGLSQGSMRLQGPKAQWNSWRYLWMQYLCNRCVDDATSLIANLWFQSIGDSKRGRPFLAVHYANMPVLYQVIKKQDCNVFDKHPGGYHIEYSNNTWNKFYCNQTLHCKSANHVYLNKYRKNGEEKDYVPYSLKPSPCWCPSYLGLGPGYIFQSYIYNYNKYMMLLFIQ